MVYVDCIGVGDGFFLVLVNWVVVIIIVQCDVVGCDWCIVGW